MACDNIVNHKHFYDVKEVIEKEVVTVVDVEPVDEPIVPQDETITDVIEPLYTEKELYSLTKQEQIGILEELGLLKKDIKQLKLEKERIDKILELIWG